MRCLVDQRPCDSGQVAIFYTTQVQSGVPFKMDGEEAVHLPVSGDMEQSGQVGESGEDIEGGLSTEEVVEDESRDAGSTSSDGSEEDRSESASGSETGSADFARHGGLKGPMTSIFSNRVCSSVFKMNGAFVGPVVRYALLEGARFDVFRFCAMRAGRRAINCMFPTVHSRTVFERDVEEWMTSLQRGSACTGYVFKFGTSVLNLRAYVGNAPLVTNLDLIGLTRNGFTLRNGHEQYGKLSIKATPFGYIQERMLSQQFKFLPSSQSTSIVPRSLATDADCWRELMLDNVLNADRCWTVLFTQSMPYDWTCSVCLDKEAGLDYGQPTSEGLYVARLPCGHELHVSCMARIPSGSQGGFSCPCCRRAYSLYKI